MKKIIGQKSNWNSEKMSNRLFILKEIEKFKEKENSIYGSNFQTVEEDIEPNIKTITDV